MKKVLFVCICLMVVGVVSVFVWHRTVRMPESLVESLPADVDIAMNNVHHESTKHGVRQWALDAEKAVYLNAENKVLFDDISTHFFLKDGETVLLTGRKGTLNTENEDIDITGNVVVKGKGYQLMTESLFYLHQDRVIVSAVPVMILGERLRLSGCGMQFDLNSGRFSLKEQVELVYGLYRKEG